MIVFTGTDMRRHRTTHAKKDIIYTTHDVHYSGTVYKYVAVTILVKALLCIFFERIIRHLPLAVIDF